MRVATTPPHLPPHADIITAEYSTMKRVRGDRAMEGENNYFSLRADWLFFSQSRSSLILNHFKDHRKIMRSGSAGILQKDASTAVLVVTAEAERKKEGE